MTAWRKVSGAELIEELDRGNLKSIVPQCSAVYVWRRELSAPQKAYSDPNYFVDWVNEVVDQVSAVVGPKDISHCVTLSGLVIGGGGLTEDKQKTAEWLSERRKVRRYVLDLIESFNEVMPPIYIGNANSLLDRTGQHLRANTDLFSYLYDELSLDWKDVRLEYLKLSDKPAEREDSKEFQEFVELVAQRVLAPIGTKRVG